MAWTNARRQRQPRIVGGMTELCSSTCTAVQTLAGRLKSIAHVLICAVFRMREPLERQTT